MKMVRGLVKGKKTTKGPSSQEITTHHETSKARKDPSYLFGFTPLNMQTSPRAYMATMLPTEEFPYTYMPPFARKTLKPRTTVGGKSHKFDCGARSK